MTSEISASKIELGLNKLQAAVAQYPKGSLDPVKVEKAIALFLQGIAYLQKPEESQPLLQKIEWIRRECAPPPPEVQPVAPAAEKETEAQPILSRSKAQSLKVAAWIADFAAFIFCGCQYGFLNAAVAMAAFNTLGLAFYVMMMQRQSPLSSNPEVPSPTGPPAPRSEPVTQPAPLPAAPKTEPVTQPGPYDELEILSPVGIYNGGNHCFLAATLQVFVFNDSVRAKALAKKHPALREFFLHHAQCQKARQICRGVGALRDVLKEITGVKRWTAGKQEDANEALSAWMNLFDFGKADRASPLCVRMEERRWYKNVAPLQQIGRKLADEWIDHAKEAWISPRQTTTEWTWGQIPVDLNATSEGKPLYQLLKASLAYDCNKNDDSLRVTLTCEGKKETVQIQPMRVEKSFVSAPERLTVFLKRFTPDRKKIDAEVAVSEKMLVGEAFYRLNGFVLHVGDTEGGHYIGYVRKGDTYYECEDGKIKIITQEYFLLLARHGYLFDYRRVS